MNASIINLQNETIEQGPTPPLLTDRQVSATTPVVFDAPLLFRKFGDCTRQPSPVAFPGQTISATFIAGNPKNNPLRGGTFFLVERKREGAKDTDRWKVVATDADWETE